MQRLFAYNLWANREEVASAIAAPERAISILAHVVGAEWLWLRRLSGDPQPSVVWPKWSLDECAEQLEAVQREWEHVLPVADPGTSVDYVNTKGERWTNTAGDILMHVALHGSYHRGQIALIVRDGGNAPAYTDYIHCVRNGWID